MNLNLATKDSSCLVLLRIVQKDTAQLWVFAPLGRNSLWQIKLDIATRNEHWDFDRLDKARQLLNSARGLLLYMFMTD